jgi:hypothetical protein
MASELIFAAAYPARVAIPIETASVRHRNGDSGPRIFERHNRSGFGRNWKHDAGKWGHAIDANGNAAVGVVISIKTGTKARVGISYAARFQAYIDDLENNYGARAVHERHPAGALFASK